MSIRSVTNEPCRACANLKEVARYALKNGMFDLISSWLATRNGWTRTRINRLGFNIAPLQNPNQKEDPVYFRLMWEAIKVRDLVVFKATPSLKTDRCNYLNRRIARRLTKLLLKYPNDQTVFEMWVYFNHKSKIKIKHLLEGAVKSTEVKLVAKILQAFPDIPMQDRRELIHYPFDQSHGVHDPEKRAAYRDMIELLDPTFAIPTRLSA